MDSTDLTLTDNIGYNNSLIEYITDEWMSFSWVVKFLGCFSVFCL